MVHVNVGGLKRSLCCDTLKKFPDTRLGKLLACDSEEDILKTGKLHIMEELCVFSFRSGLHLQDSQEHFTQEIEYWGINEFFLDSCCSYRFHDRKLESSRHHSWDEDSDVSSVDTSVDEISDLNRKCLWLTLENPGYSIPSKMFSLVSISTFEGEGKLIDDPTSQALEVFCTCWFTFEVVMRLLLAPNKRKFFHQPLNIIDLVSVAPIYITLPLELLLGHESELGDLGRLIRVLKLMTVFRVLKLARHSTGLRSLGATLRHSYREVGILLLYLAVGVSVFSGIAYTAEYETNVGLETIPACWWWGTVSMTTVGYGDVVPDTVAGKLAASGCILAAQSSGGLGEEEPPAENQHELRERARRRGGRGEEEGDDDTDDMEEDDIDYEDDGGVINYSYVEHPSYSSILKRKELHQL
ncbi:hypothetical protein F7725_016471 [Dissostichus mawsoni]|uniref:Uncharacterized protein n=1 Tax=Dissostichus mawsoni TaxID=36200 RepID=A0A7J5Z5Y8_DISMA|nr:hypothetical protein F7725_016471 [Dissostichus mawsoni]